MKVLAIDDQPEALKQIEKGTVQPKENDAAQATYFSFPDKIAVKKFIKQGKRIK